MVKFVVKKLDLESMGASLDEFYRQCQTDGITNNVSAKAMKIGGFKDQHWFGVFAGDFIVAVSGCYKSDDFGEGGWRMLFRSATLRKHRAQAGSFSKDLNHEFCFGHLLKAQKAFAQSRGAHFMYFTTNVDGRGYSGSVKANRIVENVLWPRKRVEILHRGYLYYSCRQNIWQVL